MAFPVINPILQFFDNSGNVLDGGLLSTYEPGTTTPKTTYQDENLQFANTNPIVLTSAGRCTIFTADGSEYKYVLKTSAGVTLRTEDEVKAPVGTRSGIGTVLYPRSAAEIAAGVTPADYGYPERNLTRYSGIVADGVTDCTSAILTVCNAMPGLFMLPYGVICDRKTLLQSLDPDVLIFDLSQINDLTSAGETTKHIGMISSDVAVNDSIWAVESGHHPGVMLNNYGTSGSASADSRVASLIWASGQIRNSGLQKRGPRGCAGLQFAQDVATSYWRFSVVLYAPWLAIDGEYEEWVAGEAVASGVFRRSNGAHYQSINSGTTAAPGPSHTVGTVADGGGVQWFFVDSADQSLFQLDQYGRVLIGADAVNFTFEHRPRSVDPGGGNYSMALKGTGATKTAELRLIPTDGAGADNVQPYLKASSSGMQVIRADGANAMLTLADASGVSVSNHALNFQVTAVTYSASITINSALGNSFTINPNNGTAFTINAPTNPVSGRRLKLTIRNVSGGALGVITWNAIFKLAAWTSPADTNSRSIEFEYNGTNWVEICRTTADVPN